MPRLKLPPPAKRKAQALAYVANSRHKTRLDVYRAGYAAALRAVHVIRNKEERVRRSRSWRYAGLYRLQLDQLRARIAELEKQLAAGRDSTFDDGHGGVG